MLSENGTSVYHPRQLQQSPIRITRHPSGITSRRLADTYHFMMCLFFATMANFCLSLVVVCPLQATAVVAFLQHSLCVCEVSWVTASPFGDCAPGFCNERQSGVFAAMLVDL